MTYYGKSYTLFWITPALPFFIKLDLSLAAAHRHCLCGKEKPLFQTTEWNPAFICRELRQIFTTLPLNRLLATRLWFTTAPPWAPGPVRICWGCSEQMKLHTDWLVDRLNLHFQQVVWDLAVSERSHVLQILIYKASLSCVDQWQLRRGEMWNSFGPQERSARGDGGNMWEWVRGPEKTEQWKNIIEWNLPIFTVAWYLNTTTQDWMKVIPNSVYPCHLFLMLRLSRNICFPLSIFLLPSSAVGNCILLQWKHIKDTLQGFFYGG